MDRGEVRPTQGRWRGGRLRGVVLGLTLCGLMLLPPAPARAGGVWGFSPGVKLGWTFGHGLTYGIEVSFVRLPTLDLHGTIWDMTWQAFGQVITRTYGVVINLDTNFKNLFKMRVGAEWIGPALGLEAGPELLKDKYGWHAALGITPWVGYVLIGYYTFHLTFARTPNLHEIGLYLKTPLLGWGDHSEHGWIHDHHWDD